MDLQYGFPRMYALVVNGVNVLRVFTNIYNPDDAVVEKSGVVVIAGSTYDTVGEFTLDSLGENPKAVLESEKDVDQMLATLGGITTEVANLRRVSRAYAVIGGQPYYSSAIVVDTFNN